MDGSELMEGPADGISVGVSVMLSVGIVVLFKN